MGGSCKAGHSWQPKGDFAGSNLRWGVGARAKGGSGRVMVSTHAHAHVRGEREARRTDRARDAFSPPPPPPQSPSSPPIQPIQCHPRAPTCTSQMHRWPSFVPRKKCECPKRCTASAVTCPLINALPHISTSVAGCACTPPRGMGCVCVCVHACVRACVRARLGREDGTPHPQQAPPQQHSREQRSPLAHPPHSFLGQRNASQIKVPAAQHVPKACGCVRATRVSG